MKNNMFPDNNFTQDITHMSLPDIESFISQFGKERYRARQIMKWLYQSGADSFDDMTNIAREFREQLKQRLRIGTIAVKDVQSSRDGTKKLLFELEDGAFVESVLIREKSHDTLCISTQVGCAMACTFCFTGRGGFTRNLLPGEIVGQIFEARRFLGDEARIQNIVMMGMGEPLLNYDHVVKAIEIMTCDYGLMISKRRITVSTCGIAPAIHRLGEDVCVNLAVSLNAPDDATRSRLMPINNKYPLDELLKACKNYPMPRRRMITFEYILIKNINDSTAHAERLATLMRGIHCKFNLIPFNEFPLSAYRRPSNERVLRFRDILISHRYTATIRPSKGTDILAACGQLRGKHVTS